MKKILWIKVSFLICFFFLYQSVLGQPILQEMVREQFLLLKNLAHEQGSSLEFSQVNDGSHSQMAGSKVVINISQLNNLIKSVGETHATDLVRLILAHELAHQMQYRYYGSVFSMLLNECQADILAGYLLFQIKGQDYAKWMDEQGIHDMNDPRLQNKLEIFFQEVAASLKVIFDLGDTHADNNHPRREERRRAVREGITYGNLWLLNSINNDPNIPSDKKEATLKNEKILKELLGYLPEDNVITWSLRQAKKIVHYPRFNTKNIVVFNDFKWHTSADFPYVTYHQKIKNIGDQTITINFYNQVNTVSREDPENSLFWDVRHNKAYSITLRPGEIKLIDDRLQWFASQALMPSFNYFGAKGSLYYCSTLDDHETELKQLSHPFAPSTVEDEKNLLDVIFSERNNLVKHIASVGTVPDEEDFNTIYYSSNLSLPSADETEIIYDRENNSYSLRIAWMGTNFSNDAYNVHDRLVRVLEQNGFTIGSERKFSKRSDWDVLDEGLERIGKVSLFIASNKVYSLSLQVYSD